MDRVSIIIPVYNVENYIDKCMESLVNQTYEDIEIICVDDGATDSSGIKCDEWAKKDDRIAVIHKNRGGGILGAKCRLGYSKRKIHYVCRFGRLL